MTLQDTDPSLEAASDDGRRPSDLLGSVGPLFLSVAVGVNVLFWGILWWKPPPADRTRLTNPGMLHVQPERDVLVYLGAGVVAILLAVWLSAPGRRPGRARGPWRRLLGLAAPGVALASTVAATAAFLRFRGEVVAGVRRPVKYLLVFGVVTVACVVTARLCRRAAADEPSVAEEQEGERQRPGMVVGAVDVLAPLLVAAIVYVPQWRLLAGNAFVGEAFLHLDFFAMGPALSFRHGAALGTDVLPYYGMGWPMVLAGLDALGRLTYGRVLQMEMIYGCAYFVAVYALLRMLTGSRMWAVAGTVLGILLSLFAGFSAAFVTWRFPSQTVLRWAFDVWFFLAALMYLRRRQAGWLLAAGGLVGLAVFFQTDTGLYLAAGLAFLCACAFRMAHGSRPSLRLVAGSWGLGAGVLLLGIALASRMTAFSGSRFWVGWLENLRLSVEGATLLPLVGTPGSRPVLMFVAMTAAYLAVTGYAVQQMARRRLTPASALLGIVALYGFLTLMYFVGRSNPHNLYRPTVPLAILLAGCGGLATTAAGRRAREVVGRWRVPAVRAAQVSPFLAAAVAMTMLLAHPGPGGYPNVFGPEPANAADAGRCLQLDPEDICGIPAGDAEAAGQIQALVARLKAERPAPPTVAVLDEFGPVVHLLTGHRPWGRYQPVFPSLFTRRQVESIVRELERDPPDLVVMRSAADHAPFSDDIWQAVRVPVERGFVLDSRFGPYEVWDRRPAAG